MWPDNKRTCNFIAIDQRFTRFGYFGFRINPRTGGWHTTGNHRRVRSRTQSSWCSTRCKSKCYLIRRGCRCRTSGRIRGRGITHRSTPPRTSGIGTGRERGCCHHSKTNTGGLCLSRSCCYQGPNVTDDWSSIRTDDS